MLGQALERLEEDGEPVVFVPEGHDQADLLQVVPCWVTLKEVGLSAKLLLDVEGCILALGPADE